MKGFYKLVFISTLLLLVVSFAFGQNVIINSDIKPGVLTNAFNFLEKNWAVVALVISETVAFLPNKVNGILQAVLKIGTAVFNKKNSSLQN